MTSHNTTNGMFKVPGNDGMGGTCLTAGSLPGFNADDGNWIPPKRNIFVGGLDANGSYNPAAWARCCARGEVSLAVGCYPWCEIPPETMGKDHDKDRIWDDMQRCVGKDMGSSILLNHASLPSASLTTVLAAGLVFTYMFM